MSSLWPTASQRLAFYPFETSCWLWLLMRLAGQKKWQAVIIPLAGCRIMLVLRRYLQTIAKFEYQASITVGGDHIQSDCPNVGVKLGECFIPFP